MPRSKPVLSCDCETDPFKYGRVPEPFIWGLYDGKHFQTFEHTKDFVAAVQDRQIILYAHNGGKFDYMFLLKFVKETKAQIINGRIVSMFLGHCELRDSYSIIPEPLKKFGDKKEIDYAKLERANREANRDEIREYLFYDCKILYDAVTQYRAIAGTHKTIASNALAYATRLGIDVGKTSHRFDSKYRPFYFGGRCECFKPGTHENIHLIDIHSAYPYAMLQEHATGSNFVRRNSLDGMTREEIQRAFIVIECTSNGAFPIRTRDGLSFPIEYNEFNITGWEYLVAKEYGLIDNEKILEVRYTGDTITFKPYIDHWYAYKASFSKTINPVEYTIGKIMQNSLSGKLSQNPARYYDYKIVPAGTRLDKAEGWELHIEYEGHEIHRRASLWKYKFKYGVEWEAKGIYNNVATGASITGFTRAHLLRAMCQLGREHIIYCDTDGIVCDGSTDLTALPFTDAIGDWEHEDNATIGHFAGKKLYGIKLSTGKEKIASKGSKLTYDDLVKIINGETIEWLNDAPSFSIDGSAQFVRRSIRATAHTATSKGQ